MNRSWVEVNLGQLKSNVRSLCAAIPAQMIFVIKADAYGHGMIPVARAAAEEGVNWFAVAYLEEALQLREALPDVNILVLGCVFPESVDVLLEKRITPIVIDLEHGLSLAAAARALDKTLSAHLKVDTGMGRFGVQWNEVEEAAKALSAAGGLELTGVCSHFAKVEPTGPTDACRQAEKFNKALDALPSGIFTHLSSSRAALYFPEWDFDAVRQGIVLYGYGAQDPEGRFQTKPILQWKTRVAQVKAVPAGFSVGYYGTHTTEVPTQIATLAVGYSPWMSAPIRTSMWAMKSF